MTLKEKIDNDLKDAMRARDQFLITTLRTIMAAIKNTEIEKQKRDQGLTNEEVIEVLSREIKQRRNSVAEFTKGNRQDLVQKANAEISIIKRYLPDALSENELLDIIRNALKVVNAQSMEDFGSVMKEIMPKIKGRADSSRVAQMVKEKLK